MAAERSYPGYGPRRMVMSVLGSPGSPVRCLYNLWLGAFLLYAALRFYRADAPGAPGLSALRLLCLGVFAMGAGLVTGLFSVGSSKSDKTFSAKIHGIGFRALLFHPLLDSLGAFALGRAALAWTCLGAFLLALLFFTFLSWRTSPPWEVRPWPGRACGSCWPLPACMCPWRAGPVGGCWGACKLPAAWGRAVRIL